MRIVFDAFWWESGPPSLRRILRQTVRHWAQTFPDDELVLVVRHRDLGQVRASAPAGARLVGTRLWPQALAASVAGARTRRATRADAVIVHNFAARTRGSAVFLHDVLFLTNPEWFTLIERVYFRLMAVLVPNADVVLTSSRTEADRILQHTRARNVVPVGIGMSDELSTVTPAQPVPLLRPGGFVLTVGRLNVRKNLATTIAAALRSGILSPEHPLVVVGSADGRGEALPDGALAAVADGLIVFTGYIDDAGLAWLYANTSLFLFLTRGEGFGMPAVEAAYFGAPMVVSDIEVLREVAPPEALRVPPDDVDAIAVALRTARRREQVTSPSVVPDVAAQHGWDETVRAMRAAVVASAPAVGVPRRAAV